MQGFGPDTVQGELADGIKSQEKGGKCLGYDGRPGSPCNAHAKRNHKEQVKCDIHECGNRKEKQRNKGISQSTKKR